jgi:formylglycine-generating enzyme required for sulfatase activity
MICFVFANAQLYYDKHGECRGTYKDSLDHATLVKFAEKIRGPILVKKSVEGVKPRKNLKKIPQKKIQRTLNVSRDTLGKENWLEVEKNEIVKICADQKVKAWETSLKSSILNDSCLAFQAPTLIGVETLRVHFYKEYMPYYINFYNDIYSYNINLVTGMKYLNFKNEEVLLGYNQYDKEMLAASPFLFKNNDPERKAVILGTYLVDKYPVTNCEFTQLMWDSIPAKSSHLVKYHENIQQNWVLRKNNSIRNGSCLQNDSAANMVYLHQSMKYANERSKREGLKPYYLFSSINADGEEILSKGNYIIASWDFSKHEQSYIKVTIDTSSDGYRLPYYDEWMMLARGGDKKKKAPWDKDSLTTFEDASKHAIFATAKKKFDSEPVGQRQPNGYGLYDIFGLVEEHVLFEENNLFPHYGLHPACLKGGNNRVVRNSDDKKDDFEFEPAWSEINYGYVVPNWGPALAGFRLIRNIGNNAKWTEVKSK